jgi:hypothetical protein
MWWRIPTEDELALAETEREALEAERKALEAALEGKPPPGADARTNEPPDEGQKEPSGADARTNEPSGEQKKPSGELPAPPDRPPKELPSLDDGSPAVSEAKAEPAAPDAPPPSASEPEPPPKTTPAPAPDAKPAPVPPETDEPPEEQPEPIKLPLSPETPWLEKGFFVTLADKAVENRRSWWRTARGAYVRTTHVFRHRSRDFEGVALGEDITFPVGFVMSKKEKLLELGPGDKLKVVRKVPQRTFLDLAEEIEIREKTYMMTTDGLLVRKKIMRMPELQPPPKGLEPWERWIDVDRSRQLLVAYEGSRPVYVTLVSTGKKGTKEEPFETPLGRWRIKSKHISTTMAGNTASDGNYAIQDVPWSMFFEGSYALHGAFWHRGFGYVRSHGCVNLGPSDARWLFLWTTPFLPEGWHGVNATDASPGTTIVIHD